jgi:excisionase family DNA binding protein
MTTVEATSELPGLMTVDEVAALLRCSGETVRRRIRDGEIPARRLGSAAHAPIRISRSELEAWLRPDHQENTT